MLADQRPIARTWLDLHRNQITGHCDLVEPDATNPRDFSVDSYVVMAEETDLRLELFQKDVEALRVTGIAWPTTVRVKAHAPRRIVRQHDVHALRVRRTFYLIRG